MRRLALTAAAMMALGTGGAWAFSARTNYVLHCSGCHGQDGAGSDTAGVPDLRGYVDGLASTGAGRSYLMHVPGVANAPLPPADLAAVMNYLLEAFTTPDRHPDAHDFTADEVMSLKSAPLPDVVGARREVVRDLRARGVPVATYPWE